MAGQPASGKGSLAPASATTWSTCRSAQQSLVPGRPLETQRRSRRQGLAFCCERALELGLGRAALRREPNARVGAGRDSAREPGSGRTQPRGVALTPQAQKPEGRPYVASAQIDGAWAFK